VTFAEDYRSILTHRRRPLAQPNKPIQGSTADRKLDIGFVDDPKAGKDSKCHWSHILIPGELKSNPAVDKASKAYFNIGTYASPRRLRYSLIYIRLHHMRISYKSMGV